MIEIRAGQPEAAVRLQADGDLRGEWDTDRLAQLVSNLIGNANNTATERRSRSPRTETATP